MDIQNDNHSNSNMNISLKNWYKIKIITKTDKN